LHLNKDTNKRHVAIEKILQYHPNIDMEQLFELGSEGEWSLRALPYMIDWFERAMEAMEALRYTNKSHDAAARAYKELVFLLIFGSCRYELGRERSCYIVSRRKLSAIYQFAHAMPLLFVPASHAKDKSTMKMTKRLEMKSMNKVATDNCCVIL